MFMDKGELIELLKHVYEPNIDGSERQRRMGKTKVTLIHSVGHTNSISIFQDLYKSQRNIVNTNTFIDRDFIYPYKFMKVRMEQKLPDHKYCEDMVYPLWSWTSMTDFLNCHFYNPEETPKDDFIVVFKKSLRHILFSDYLSWHTVMNTGWPNYYDAMTRAEFSEFYNEFHYKHREDVNSTFLPMYWDMSIVLQATTWEIKPSEILTMGIYTSNNGYTDITGVENEYSEYINNAISNYKPECTNE